MDQNSTISKAFSISDDLRTIDQTMINALSNNITKGTGNIWDSNTSRNEVETGGQPIQISDSYVDVNLPWYPRIPSMMLTETTIRQLQVLDRFGKGLDLEQTRSFIRPRPFVYSSQ